VKDGEYEILYEQFAKEFHNVFFNTTSNAYADGMQAAQVLALSLPDVVPTNVRSAVVDISLLILIKMEIM